MEIHFELSATGGDERPSGAQQNASRQCVLANVDCRPTIYLWREHTVPPRQGGRGDYDVTPLQLKGGRERGFTRASTGVG